MIDRYCKYSDEELVKIIRSGDNFAMEYLINKYKKLVRNKANTLFIVGADSEDIIQEGMIGLFKAIREYSNDRDAKFITFADICISRQIYTAVRAAQRKKHLPLNSYISTNITVYDENTDTTLNLLDAINHNAVETPEERVIGRENAEYIEKAMEERLSDFEKEVVFLYVKGVDYLQIAQILNKEPKSIDNAIQRIKKKVTAIIKDEK